MKPPALDYALIVTDLFIIEMKIAALRQCLKAFDDTLAADIENDLQTAESYVSNARQKGGGLLNSEGCNGGEENQQATRINALLAIATTALERITKCEDAPEIDATGECQYGLHCGVEDRNCQDRYQGADFGHAEGVEKALEWASNEAKHALEQMAKDKR